MIFMRNRRAEQGKDTVAKSLGDIAVIPMHRIHHELQRGVDDGASFFGVESFNEGRRTFQVCEQCCDGLALSITRTSGFHRRLFGQDALGEIGGRVRYGRLRRG